MNIKTALLGLFVVLTIAFASTTAYEAGRTTFTSTSTLTQTTTVTSTTVMTSALFSSVSFGNAALAVNSSSGLGLLLQVEPGPDGNYTFTVTESNLLNSLNNAAQADEWYSQNSLSACGPPGVPTPVELAVLQGSYDQSNYTSGKALPFYDPGVIRLCTKMGVSGPTMYTFQPLNDSFSFYSGPTVWSSGTASVSLSTIGYWTGGEGNVPAAFRPFGPGIYTVVGADEWGNVVLLHAFLE